MNECLKRHWVLLSWDVLFVCVRVHNNMTSGGAKGSHPSR